ncbi:uncharacterized protein si:dkey-175m17.7 isoform X2 [Brienomyrus brachyistius]|uniref:uncharacterized protein si:dkey-175m17.7 isoform X2 n=1 Tax=Brienomyrus brachyistius TaxID=42636 RepID=UPI0020B3CF41|nr:uncharacterized protein si:dkey-175m17.7 isoform X2 [Brienomyrus brachyistius]
MPPLPLDERIVVIQRPKTLPLSLGSLQSTPQHSIRNNPTAPPSQPHPLPPHSRSRPSVYPNAEGKPSSSSNQWRAREERAVDAESSYSACGHSHGDETLTFGSGRNKQRHTLDIKLSLGSRGEGSLERGPWSSESHGGSLKGRREKKLSLHLDLRQEDGKVGGTSGRPGEVVVQQVQNPFRVRDLHSKPSSGAFPGIVLAEGRHPELRKETDLSRDLREVSSVGDKASSKLGTLLQAPYLHHSLPRHYGSTPTAHHTSTLRNPYPPVITAVPSHALPQFLPLSGQSRFSRGRERHLQHLHSLPLSPSSSRGFPSPDHSCTINLQHPFNCGCWRLVCRDRGGGHSRGCQGCGQSPSSTLSRSQGAGGAGSSGGIFTSGVMGLRTLGGCLSNASTTNTSSSGSTMSDCRAGLLGPLRCKSCSGNGFGSPTSLHKKLIGGCLPCSPLSTSSPLRALHNCVTGCDPKGSQAGSSSCSYCSSDPIVVTYNPRRLKPPEVTCGSRPLMSGRFSLDDDDDDYSVRTIWPEELSQKMTKSKVHHDQKGLGMAPGPRNQYQSSSNGTSPMILDCRNLLEFTRSHLADHAGRRRLQQGKAAVLDFIGSGSSQNTGRDSLKRLWTKSEDRGMMDGSGQDEEPGLMRSFSSRSASPISPLSFSPPPSSHSTLNKPKPWERGTLPSARSLHLVLNSLNAEQDEENMRVHLSLPLSSSLPTSLSDEGLTTPDVENAAISSILPFLFLGNERDGQDLDLLLRLHIGFVVNVTTHLPLYHLDTGLIHYKRLPATDNSKQNLRQYFEEVFEFIEEAHQRGRGVLVHCQAGVSRSATIVIAYLMKHTRMTMMDAYKYVRSRRPVVSPNLNFMGQLLEFEKDLNSGITPRILTPKLNGLETQGKPEVNQVYQYRL